MVSDIDSRSLLEVIDSHKSDEIIDILQEKQLEIRENVKEVSVDMWVDFKKLSLKFFLMLLLL